MNYMGAVLALAVSWSIPAWAKIGVDSSGGGSECAAYLVGSGRALLERTPFAAEHRSLLERALEESRIKVTSVLIDPQTGEEIANQSQLLAYSSPGLIQLKDSSAEGSSDSFEAAMKERRPLAHIIVHELFRASGAVGPDGRSVDDNYQLSIGRYKLNRVDSKGNSLREPVESHYWKCQCFEDGSAGAPMGGMNLIGFSSLFDAEKEALVRCKEIADYLTIARCHKFVGDPYKY